MDTAGVSQAVFLGPWTDRKLWNVKYYSRRADIEGQVNGDLDTTNRRVAQGVKPKEVSSEIVGNLT